VLRESTFKTSGNVAVLLDGEDLAATRSLSKSTAFAEVWVVNNGEHADIALMRRRAARIMRRHPGLTVNIEEAWLGEWLRTKGKRLRGRVDLLWADFCGTWDWERRDAQFGSVAAIRELVRGRLLAQHAKLAVTVSSRYRLGVDYGGQVARTLCSDVPYEFKRHNSSAVPLIQTGVGSLSYPWEAYRGVGGGGMIFAMWEITHDRPPGETLDQTAGWLVYWDPDVPLPLWQIWSVVVSKRGKSQTIVRFTTGESVSVPNIQVKLSEAEAVAYRAAVQESEADASA
jgi:hypothetical protein